MINQLNEFRTKFQNDPDSVTDEERKKLYYAVRDHLLDTKAETFDAKKKLFDMLYDDCDFRYTLTYVIDMVERDNAQFALLFAYGCMRETYTDEFATDKFLLETIANEPDATGRGIVAAQNLVPQQTLIGQQVSQKLSRHAFSNLSSATLVSETFGSLIAFVVRYEQQQLFGDDSPLTQQQAGKWSKLRIRFQERQEKFDCLTFFKTVLQLPVKEGAESDYVKVWQRLQDEDKELGDRVHRMASLFYSSENLGLFANRAGEGDGLVATGQRLANHYRLCETLHFEMLADARKMLKYEFVVNKCPMDNHKTLNMLVQHFAFGAGVCVWMQLTDVYAMRIGEGASRLMFAMTKVNAPLAGQTSLLAMVERLPQFKVDWFFEHDPSGGAGQPENLTMYVQHGAGHGQIGSYVTLQKSDRKPFGQLVSVGAVEKLLLGAVGARNSIDWIHKLITCVYLLRLLQLDRSEPTDSLAELVEPLLDASLEDLLMQEKDLLCTAQKNRTVVQRQTAATTESQLSAEVSGISLSSLPAPPDASSISQQLSELDRQLENLSQETVKAAAQARILSQQADTSIDELPQSHRGVRNPSSSQKVVDMQTLSQTAGGAERSESEIRPEPAVEPQNAVGTTTENQGEIAAKSSEAVEAMSGSDGTASDAEEPDEAEDTVSVLWKVYDNQKQTVVGYVASWYGYDNMNDKLHNFTYEQADDVFNETFFDKVMGFEGSRKVYDFYPWEDGAEFLDLVTTHGDQISVAEVWHTSIEERFSVKPSKERKAIYQAKLERRFQHSVAAAWPLESGRKFLVHWRRADRESGEEEPLCKCYTVEPAGKGAGAFNKPTVDLIDFDESKYPWKNGLEGYRLVVKYRCDDRMTADSLAKKLQKDRCRAKVKKRKKTALNTGASLDTGKQQKQVAKKRRLDLEAVKDILSLTDVVEIEDKPRTYTGKSGPFKVRFVKLNVGKNATDSQAWHYWPEDEYQRFEKEAGAGADLRKKLGGKLPAAMQKLDWRQLNMIRMPSLVAENQE